MKRHQETALNQSPGIGPQRYEDAGPLLIAGLKETYRGSNAGIPAQWQRFAPHVGKVPGQLGAAAYGVCFAAGDGGSGFAYMAGVEVAAPDALPDAFSTARIPAQRYAVFHHDGHVSGLPDTIHRIMSQWLPGSGHETGAEPAFFERYGEAFDPQTGTGGVEIWVPLKPDEA